MKYIFQFEESEVQRLKNKAQTKEKEHLNSKELVQSEMPIKPVSNYMSTPKALSQQHAGKISMGHKVTIDTEDIQKHLESVIKDLEKDDRRNHRQQENTVPAVRKTVAHSSSVNRTAAQADSGRRHYKIGTIAVIGLCLAFVLFFVYAIFIHNPLVGRNYKGEVYSTRLSSLCTNKKDWLYAKSYDFDNDGVDEIIFLKKLKNEENEEAIYFGILKEGEESYSVEHLGKDTLNIPYGIYEHNGKNYVGIPVQYSVSSPDTVENIFTFVEVEDYYSEKADEHSILIFDANDSRLSQYKLVYEFPFNKDTSDYSQFKSTVKNEIEKLRDSYK